MDDLIKKTKLQKADSMIKENNRVAQNVRGDDHEFKVSPIEEVFSKNLRSSLLAYESYYQNLLLEYNQKRLQLQADHESQKEHLKAKVAVSEQNLGEPSSGEIPPSPTLKRTQSTEEAIQILSKIDGEYKQKLKFLKDGLDKSVSLLVQAYESYMSGIAPSPFLLPTKVTISVAGRNGLKCEALLKPTDPVETVKQLLADKCKGMGNPISEFDPDMKYAIKSPMSDKKINDLETINGLSRVCELKEKIFPGAEILLIGAVKLESEAPETCFTADYKQGGDQRVDYFRCNTCGLNWICKPCSGVCHKGHDIVSFMKNHKPSYACCYCVKKKKCRILNNRSKKGD